MFQPSEEGAAPHMLTVVRVGSFSGSGLALRDALGEVTDVTDFDVQHLSRSPRMVLSRIASTSEARLAGAGIPWTKTATWSRAVQRHLVRRIKPDSDILFIQTLLAPVLGPHYRYLIYTDRVGLEGATVGGTHRSRFSAGWLRREKRFIQNARHVFVMGPSTEKVLVDQYELAPERVHVVGAGPNSALRSQVQSDQCRTILFVGTQWELKGGPELMEAFEEVRRRQPGMRLLLVGSQPESAVPDDVIAVGRIPHDRMDHIYSQADLVAIPTHMEAFGISLVEALIKGLPCIGTTVGNQSWIIGEAGKCVPPGNVKALAEALLDTITRYPDYAHRARIRGAELSREMSWERVAEQIQLRIAWG